MKKVILHVMLLVVSACSSPKEDKKEVPLERATEVQRANEEAISLARAEQLQAEKELATLQAELDQLVGEGERLDQELQATLEAYKTADEAQKKALDANVARLRAEKAASTERKGKLRKGSRTTPATE